MSADNSIVILQCKDSFRVEHLQAIDNKNWHYNSKINNWEERDYCNDFIVYNWFKSSPQFDSQEKAINYAMSLNDSIGYVEYGICFIDDWKDKEFPKNSPDCCDKPSIYWSDDELICDNCHEYIDSERSINESR